MRKMLSIFLITAFILVVSGYCFGAREIFKGYFVTTDGKTQAVSEFVNLKLDFSCTYQGNRIKIPLEDIKSIIVIGKWEDKIVVVEKRNGKMFKVEGRLDWIADSGCSPAKCILYKFYDEINEHYSKAQIIGLSVKEIVFDEDFGSLRKCQKCGRTFPPDYLFCPYDKSPMRLIQVK